MWSCPKCETKVDAGFEVCWKCGTTREGVEDPGFLSADEEPPIADPLYDPVAQVPEGVAASPFTPGDDLAAAYQAQGLMEAKFIADELMAAGIAAMADTQDFQYFLGTMEGNPRVWVRRDDLDRARAWVEAYDAKRRLEHGG
jgi:hypothetical protein